MLIRCLHLLGLAPYSLRGRTLLGTRHIVEHGVLRSAQPGQDAEGYPVLSETLFEAAGRMMATCLPGRFIGTHLPHHPRIVALCQQHSLKSLLMVRDPRDGAVSLAFFLVKERDHFLHKYFSEHLPDTSARLMAAIRGVPPGAPDAPMGVRPVNKRIEQYSAWAHEPFNRIVRFEELVGPKGGGSAEAQVEALRRICAHLNLRPSPGRLDAVARRLFSPKSPTFRKGAIGDWKNHFTAEHKATFKELAGQLLIDLGYERDLDW